MRSALSLACAATLGAGLLLSQKGPVDPAKEKVTVDALHKRIAAKPVTAPGKPYKHTIPGTDVSYEMLPIPAGEFLMGNPDGEAGSNPDEGPQHRV